VDKEKAFDMAPRLYQMGGVQSGC